jgi:hypothetical protein
LPPSQVNASTVAATAVAQQYNKVIVISQIKLIHPFNNSNAAKRNKNIDINLEIN